MDEAAKRECRIQEVSAMLTPFCHEKLDDDLRRFVSTLWKRLKRQRDFPMTLGKTEVLAAAIVYVIGRVNLIFKYPLPGKITPEEVFDYFGVKKSTVYTKTLAIERLFGLGIGGGDSRICRQENWIHNVFTSRRFGGKTKKP